MSFSCGIFVEQCIKTDKQKKQHSQLITTLREGKESRLGDQDDISFKSVKLDEAKPHPTNNREARYVRFI